MNWPGEALLIKLVDVISNGIGTGLRPWTIKRDARAEAMGAAEARRIDRISQERLRQEFRDIRAGRKLIGPGYRLIKGPEPSQSDSPAQLQQVKAHYLENIENSRLTPNQFIEIERRINLEQMAALAIEEALGDETGPPDAKPIEDDWFAQWRNRAQDVSNEEMQRLWARVLTGETHKTGSFSIHTLEFLSRMSREDADLIGTLGVFALNGRHVLNGAAALEAAGLTFEKLLYLQDLGILSGVTGLNNTVLRVEFGVNGVPRAAPVRCNDKGLVCRVSTDDKKAIEIIGYPISVVGRELLTLASCSANLDYLKETAEALRSQCDSIHVADAVGSRDRYTLIGEKPI